MVYEMDTSKRSSESSIRVEKSIAARRPSRGRIATLRNCSVGGPDNAEYLTPVLLQDAQFPHVVPAKTGVPGQVFDLMRRIRAELPPTCTRSRLAVKTYLKMILILLVNQYSSYAGTIEIFQRQQRALDRLHPLFDHLGQHFGEPIQVRD